MQAMLLSTSYNSLETVLSNLYHAFTEVAQKSYGYLRSLTAIKRPGSKLLISRSTLPASCVQTCCYGQLMMPETVDDTVKLACVLMRHRKRSSKDILPYECRISGSQTRW